MTRLPVFALLAIAIAPSYGEVLYTNGPIKGTKNAYAIGATVKVSNSFELRSESTVTGVEFGVWTVATGLSTIDWSIGLTPFGSDEGFAQAAPVATALHSLPGIGNYSVYSATLLLPGLKLSPGTHYLTLGGAITQGTFHVQSFWDANGGPSTVLAIGSTPTDGSNAFQILGAVPEPASWALLALGLLLLPFEVRRSNRGA